MFDPSNLKKNRLTAKATTIIREWNFLMGNSLVDELQMDITLASHTILIQIRYLELQFDR